METSNSDNTSQETDVTLETKCVRRKSLLGLVTLGSSIFLAGCTLSLLAPFYTKVAEDHGLSITSSGTVFASAFVLQIVSTPIFGKYLQRIGSARLEYFTHSRIAPAAADHVSDCLCSEPSSLD